MPEVKYPFTPEVKKKCYEHPKLKCYMHVEGPTGPYELFKRWIFPGPIIASIRILLALIFFIFHYLCQKILFIGFNDWDKPFPRWRYEISRRIFSFWISVIFAVLGFQADIIDHSKEIHETDKERQPIYQPGDPFPLVGTHMTFFDIIVMIKYGYAPSFMAKDETLKVPIVGFLLKVLRCIIVYRDPKLKEKHASAAELLTERIAHPLPGDHRPLCFVEGTTGNGTCITRIRKGAFIAGKPVRPFALSYPARHRCANWDTVSVPHLLYDIATQYVNHIRLEFFPVYYPSPEEQADPELYAHNMGVLLSTALGLPFREDVDLREKLVCLQLVNGKISWEEAEQIMAKNDADRAAEEEKKRMKKEGKASSTATSSSSIVSPPQ